MTHTKRTLTIILTVSLLLALSLPTTAATRTVGGFLPHAKQRLRPLTTVDSGVAPSPAARSASAVTSSVARTPLAAENLPAAYRSDSDGCLTPAKNQQDTNLCWAFSAVACAETEAIKNEEFSKSTLFSEWALAYFQFHSVVDPLGGLAGDTMTLSGDYTRLSSNLFLATQTLSNWKGIHDESRAPLETMMNNHFAPLPDALCYNDMLHLENSRALNNRTAADRTAVKAAIYSQGAVSTGLYYDDAFYNRSANAYHNDIVPDANHAVTLVGWDDAFPRTRFSAAHRPQADGAWLVKNSWGADFGENGLFWLSYEDLALKGECVYALDFAPADNFDRNYQYDGTPGFATLDFPKGTATVACVFTAADDELLKAGSLFHYAEGKTNYTLTVYKNPTSARNPASGTAVSTVSGVFDTEGLYTVRLKDAVPLQKGEVFSLVFSLSCQNKLSVTLSLPNEVLDEGGTLVAHNSGKRGEGFYMKNGAWADAYADFGASLRLHAYTSLKNPSATSASSPTSSATEPTDGLKGDVNCDKSVNMKDVLALRKVLAGHTALLSLFNADTNSDGAVNMKDVLVLRKMLAGLL